jgi:WbqC-like protein family
MTRSHVVAIHQPDLLPWIGFFVKVAKANTLIVLDHVENNPRRAFLCKRVSFQLPAAVGYLGLSLEAPPSGQIGVPLTDMRLAADMPKIADKLLKTIEQTYRRAPHYATTFPLVSAFLLSSEVRLVQRNMSFIDTVLEHLELRPRQLYSSTLSPTLSGGELVAELCSMAGADVYISGEGGRAYQTAESFERRGIRIAYNHFAPTPYPRFQGEFAPGLSIVDALMNLGFEGTAALVADGVQTSEAEARACGEAIEPVPTGRYQARGAPGRAQDMASHGSA